MNGVRLVIVVPCYNEEEVLKETTRQLSDVLARMEQEGKAVSYTHLTLPTSDLV